MGSRADEIRAELLRREIARRAQVKQDETAPAAEAPEGGGIGTTLKAAAMAPGIGAGEMAATVLGAPASFVSGAASLAGFPQVGEAIQGATIEGQREMLNLPEMRAAQDLESVPAIPRVAIRGLEMMAGGGVATAPLVVGMRAAKAAGKALPAALDLLARDPTAVAKVQGAIDFASGAAGETAAQISEALGGSPDNREAARAWTSLVTAFGGPAAVRMVGGVIQGGRDAIRPKPQARLEQDVGMTLEPADLSAGRTNAAQFTNRGMQPPPLGSLTGDPALQARQSEVLRTVPGAAGREQARQAATDTQIRGTMDAATPPGDPSRVAGGLENAMAAEQQAAQRESAALHQELMATVREQRANREAVASLRANVGESLEDAVRAYQGGAEQRATAALETLGRGLPAREAGDVYVAQLNEARTTFRRQANAAYESVLRGSEMPVDVSGITAAAQAATAAGNDLAGVAAPSILRQIAEAEVATQTPRQLQSLRSDLLDELRMAQGGATENPAAARRIATVLEEVDNVFETLEDALPGLRPLNAWYREGKTSLHGGRFKDVGRALRSKGGVELDPSEVAARFLRADTQTGADEAMEQFNRAFGGRVGLEAQPGIPGGIAGRAPDAIAQRALDEQIIAQMRLAVADPVTGTVDRGKLRTWVAERQTALARRPELNRRLQSVSQAQGLADSELARIASLRASYERDVLKAAGDPTDEFLSERVASAKRELARFDRTASSREARQARAWEVFVDDPQGAVGELLAGSPVKARFQYRKLERALKNDPDARDGLRAALWRAMVARVTGPETGAAAATPLLSADGFAKMLQQHGGLVREVFGPGREELLRVMQSLAKQNTAGGVPTPTNKHLGGSGNVAGLLSHITSRAYGVARGVVGVPYVVTEAIARTVFGNRAGELNQAAAHKLLERAILDADVYDSLIQAAKHPREQKHVNRLATILSGGRQVASQALDDRPLRTRQDLRALYQRREEKQREKQQRRQAASYGGVRG